MAQEKKVEKQEAMKKSPAFLQTADGQIYEVEPDIAQICGTIYQEMQAGRGCSQNNPISVPATIKRNYLVQALTFCRYCHDHKGSNACAKNFLRMDARVLCEFILVADYLQVKSFMDRTTEAMFKRFRSLQYVKEFFSTEKWPYDISKEDLLERVDLVTRLVKERITKDEEQLKLKKAALQNKPRNFEDTRSINDLLQFIDGGDGGSKGVSSSKKKKKNKKKDGKKNAPSASAASASDKASDFNEVRHNEINTQDTHTSETTTQGTTSTSSISTTFADKLKLVDTNDKSVSFEDDVDDGNFDPSLSEELDREVLEGRNEINTQDTHTSETTTQGTTSTSSISTTFANKLKLLDTNDKSVSFEDDVDDGNFDPSLSDELDWEVLEGRNEINTQDTHTSETTTQGTTSTSSISTTFANKLKLLDTNDKSVSFEDDVDDGNFDPSLRNELDREVADFARRLIIKPPVIYFDSSSQEVDLVQVSPKGKGSRMKGLSNLH